MQQIYDIFMTLLPILLLIAEIGLLVWAGIDLTKRAIRNKIFWALVILFVPIIGPIAYLIGRNHRER